MKRYRLINDVLGWVCFLVAAVTYLLTVEPTASFWDCPEFIAQGTKLEVGHPPGNPIFMLAARFFVNFAWGDMSKAALMVNSMSALLSAGTILLLFWTITHLVKRLIVKDDAGEVSLTQMLVIFGSGLCGALMYAWSDTFWFSAVEGEVYAFSSFCTALVMLARGDGRCYIITESASALLCLVLKVAGYRIGGFAGLGAAYVLHYAAYSAMVLWVYRRRYGLRLGRGVPALCAMAVATAFAALAFKCLWGWAPVVLVLPWLLPLALRRLLAHTNNNRKNNVYKNKRMR